MCGTTRAEALTWLTQLETLTQPAVPSDPRNGAVSTATRCMGMA